MPARQRRESPSDQDATVTPINGTAEQQNGQSPSNGRKPTRSIAGTIVAQPGGKVVNVKGEPTSVAEFRVDVPKGNELKRYNVTAWGDLADDVLNNDLAAGDKVKVMGRLKRDAEEFTRGDGTTGTSSPEISADYIGVEVAGKMTPVSDFDRSMLTPAPALDGLGSVAGGMSAAD